MQGKIIKGIAGFYYVHVVHSGIYECKAKGVFRNKKIKPLVGDNVEIEILDEGNRIGNIINIYDRENELIRPAVSNISQALVVFAIANPMPNLNLLDRFLVMMERNEIDTIICFNKIDLVDEEEILKLRDIYVKAGYHVMFTSTKENMGIEEVLRVIDGKTTAFAGPSGVGKSSLLNALIPEANSQTGEISEKIKRGKHTTRHTEIFNVSDDTYLMDTPGFSSLYVNDFEKEELKNYFREFIEYNNGCRFTGCVHVNEPDCLVKEAVENGGINRSRYDNYILMYEEIKNKKSTWR
ncbi:ribosome small subunit-dependent GTPase A [Bovifimicola ammoniilytica]|uniref:ribosome small subunit-dependent GTPase A n=1 Tax=Bovifimicola ammoniilytica TaxID=2981720 RepID=UPI00033EDDD2|nr:ribosome small subunit-dependent GTPase A [Bovifimicola ammoniilytica]MCU6754006.1 ribosome small subunit-dependent GTPase A [Bovifimicola ammoniilytica]CCZ04625.1 putative ribosome biogenesis GTPase RsgA [Eubacterium sp. CAG:603]SCJ77855.1 Putative ribosome biogenesis GTPase RsgA [uncultured Eubacterium sp.]